MCPSQEMNPDSAVSLRHVSQCESVIIKIKSGDRHLSNTTEQLEKVNLKLFFFSPAIYLSQYFMFAKLKIN